MKLSPSKFDARLVPAFEKHFRPVNLFHGRQMDSVVKRAIWSREPSDRADATRLIRMLSGKDKRFQTLFTQKILAMTDRNYRAVDNIMVARSRL